MRRGTVFLGDAGQISGDQTSERMQTSLRNSRQHNTRGRPALTAVETETRLPTRTIDMSEASDMQVNPQRAKQLAENIGHVAQMIGAANKANRKVRKPCL